MRASGELDHENCAEFESILLRMCGDGHGLVVLALDELSFIDSCGLRVLIRAATIAEKAGCKLHIASMTPHLEHVLTVSGFKDMFVTEPVVQQAQPMAPDTTREYCFETVGASSACGQARNKVSKFAKQMGFDEMHLDDIKLAVGEAMSNAVRHGSVNTESIEITCRSVSGTLVVTIKYPSTEFNPDSVPVPTFATAPEGGMGIYFIKLVMDSVHYEFKDGCTILTMEKAMPQT